MTTETIGAPSTSTPAPTSTDGATTQHSQADVEKAFSAGYSSEEAPGTTPAATSPTKKEETTPAPAKKADASASTAAPSAPASSTTPPAATPAASTEGPKFAGFSEEEIKRVLALVPENSRQYGELAKQMRQISGWIGGINHRLEKLHKPASASAPAASSGVAKSIAESEAMKKLKEDLPDVHQAIMDALAAIPAPAAGGPSKEDLEKLVQGRVAQELGTFRAEQQKREQGRLFKAHPELREAAAKAAPGTPLMDLMPGFKLWFAAQPADYQAEFLAAEDAATVSEAFTKFKDHQKSVTASADDKAKADAEAKKKADEEAAKKARQQDRLERAAAPSGVPASSHSGLTPQEAFEAGFKGDG